MKKTLLAAVALAASLSGSSLALEATPAINVKPILKTTTSWNGNSISYPAGQAEITGMIIEVAPGAETGWHEHPVPSFGMVLNGTLEVTLKDGRKKRAGPGEGMVEVVDTLHNGRNVGTVPVRIIVFYAGAVGTPLTVKR